MPETYDRATTYERVVDGQVVERVQPIVGDYEDTRLGLLALHGTGGWRQVNPEPVDAASHPPPVPEPTTRPVNNRRRPTTQE